MRHRITSTLTSFPVLSVVVFLGLLLLCGCTATPPTVTATAEATAPPEVTGPAEPTAETTAEPTAETTAEPTAETTATAEATAAPESTDTQALCQIPPEKLPAPKVDPAFSIVYALLEQPAYIIKPSLDPPDKSKDEVQALGTMEVVTSVTEDFVPGTYTIAFSGRSPGQICFVDNAKGGGPIFEANVYTLPRALNPERPVAALSSEQLCIAWDTTQYCAMMKTPPPAQLTERLLAGLKGTRANPELFELNSTIPEVEGPEMVAKCAEVLVGDPSQYAKCKATVISAPLRESGLLPPLQELPGLPEQPAGAQMAAANAPINVTSTGVFDVLEPLVGEEVYSDLAQQQPVDALPAGTYLVYDIELPDRAMAALVTQVGQEPAYYMPAVIGVPLVGGDQMGTTSQDYISNLWRHTKNCHWSCYFRWLECPH